MGWFGGNPLTSVSSSRGSDAGPGGGADGAAGESLSVAADDDVAEAAGGVIATAGPARRGDDGGLDRRGCHDGGEAEVGVQGFI